MSVSFSPKYFEVGSLYRAKMSFMSGATTVFVEGETLAYEDDFFSHYDDAFVYQFHSQTDGQTKSWWLFQDWLKEGKSDADWQQFFEPIVS
jgi:hypothetical protein